MMQKQEQLRQGDILLIRVDKNDLPLKKFKVKTNGVIAEGEVTGHAHRLLTSACATLFENDNDEMALVVKEKPAEITHEDHGTLSVPSGFWKISHQVEYTPERMERVID